MIRAVVTDIEGTTSSLSFVKEVLFPYARSRLAGFVKDHCDDPDVQDLLGEVRHWVGQELALEEIIAQLEQWSDADQKIAPLKSLQGMIWQAGYEKGDFLGHIYPDAVSRLKEWKNQGLDLYVFSSGSVAAQQLLFAHTAFGDLTPLFSGFFDTRTGSKQAAQAYRKIASAIGIEAAAVLFLSDVRAELDAAQEAGMKTTWLIREGAMPEQTIHPAVRSFSEISILR